MVRLRRRDLLGQAISLARARQSGAWISSQAPVRPASYDGDAVERALSDLVVSNAGWDLTLARGGIAPLDVTFEEVVADLDATVQRVADHLGVAVEAVSTGALPRPARQSDGINDDWRTRFLAEGRPLVSSPPSPPRGRLHRIARRLGATLRG